MCFNKDMAAANSNYRQSIQPTEETIEALRARYRTGERHLGPLIDSLCREINPSYRVGR